MFGSNHRLNDIVAVLDGIHAASQTTSEKLTAAVDLSKFGRVVFLIDNGTLGVSGTLDFQVKASATSGGTYTAVPLTAIAQQLVATDNNKYLVVDVDVAKIADLNLGYAWIKGSLVPGTAAAISSVTVLGVATAYGPASTYNAATVSAASVNL
jgi:hypothetical protein